MLGIDAFHDPLTTCLPTEIASRILTFCVDTDQEIERRIPLALSAVSRRWRDIAQSTPALWTSIRLQFKSAPIQSSCEEMLRHWILHSSQRQLSIHLSIDSCDRKDAFAMRVYRTIIEILNAHSYRWGKPSLRIPVHLLNLFRGEIHGAPDLHWLSIGTTSKKDDEDGQIPKFDLGGPLPAPRTVFFSPCRLSRIRIDWMNVTDVHMLVPYIGECLALFATAPRLRECKLVYVRDDDDASGYPSTPIIHHHLLKLEVARTRLNSISPFFDHLCCPSLESLRYDCGSQPLDPLQSFLVRSSAPLKFLPVEETSYFNHEINLTNLLWAIPSLEELEIFCSYLYDEFWELLATYSEGNPAEQFLPMLMSVSLGGQSGVDREHDLQKICKALEVRTSCDRADRGLGVLKRLNWHMNIEHYLDEETLQLFERLIEDGLDFELTNQEFGGSDMIKYSRAYYDEMRDQSANAL
ncbi:hypothetical protein NLJ89_g11227 [Agrocybe chaxingu]|uniref:F-box domain-containing protein n=1 Tax=Agrocybe chaxingu TaxID=84603 RepID=A0A9W8JM98_9AGAR|nr:hypothetical protein NLJ89_g11227 [Agrocybe chaxingu]